MLSLSANISIIYRRRCRGRYTLHCCHRRATESSATTPLAWARLQLIIVTLGRRCTRPSRLIMCDGLVGERDAPFRGDELLCCVVAASDAGGVGMTIWRVCGRGAGCRFPGDAFGLAASSSSSPPSASEALWSTVTVAVAALELARVTRPRSFRRWSPLIPFPFVHAAEGVIITRLLGCMSASMRRRFTI